ncbi:acetyltransferase [Cupriavidus oxalaticus]|uniref:Acetyltransferase n=1 Tax=Cupriavidus oxalaticus TaxID=96344 RepID=A0A5P3VCG3_9BURK|nr:acetyltransferase [Cupriavidus oxalaticus]QEZ44074.1 acetyltransferase [Cupriavidus oxalaticus]
MPLRHSEPVSSVVIAGAGGLALEIFDYLYEESLAGGPAVAGFIDDEPGRVPDGVPRPYLTTIGDFRPAPGQVVVVAIGAVRARRKVIERLSVNGVPLPAYAHRLAIVSREAQLGMATMVCPFAIVNRNAVMGDGTLAGVHCSVGHGARVGAYSILSPFAALNGDASIGEGCFLGTRATIYPRIHIGRDCVVDSHTGVRANAPDRQMISSRGTYQINPLRLPV